MPRKTRVLHDEREYLFVDAPGDVAGPALLIFARSDDAKAVARGRQPTHQTEHGLWCQIARFDGDDLLLAPDPPDGLDALLQSILPRYVELRKEANRQATNACWFLQLDGRAAH